MKKVVSAVLALVLLVSALAGCSSGTAAYPSKNVSIIVPYSAGGTSDLCVRGVLNAIPSNALPKNVNLVVSNLPGGAGLVGINKLVGSPNDGYTLGSVNCDFLLNSCLGNTDLTLDKFIPLACIEKDPYLIVIKSDAPYKTFKEFIEYAKANPGKVTIGDTGDGAVPHLAVTAMEKLLGVTFKTVSYDSSGDSVVAVVSGEVDATVTVPSPALGQLQAGTIVPITVTAKERLTSYPDVPTIGEVYPEASDMQVISWICLAALADTDDGNIQFLKDTLSKAVTSDTFKQTLENSHMQEINMNDEELAQFIKDQTAFYQEMVK